MPGADAEAVQWPHRVANASPYAMAHYGANYTPYRGKEAQTNIAISKPAPDGPALIMMAREAAYR